MKQLASAMTSPMLAHCTSIILIHLTEELTYYFKLVRCGARLESAPAVLAGQGQRVQNREKQTNKQQPGVQPANQ